MRAREIRHQTGGPAACERRRTCPERQLAGAIQPHGRARATASERRPTASNRLSLRHTTGVHRQLVACNVVALARNHPQRAPVACASVACVLTGGTRSERVSGATSLHHASTTHAVQVGTPRVTVCVTHVRGSVDVELIEMKGLIDRSDRIDL